MNIAYTGVFKMYCSSRKCCEILIPDLARPPSEDCQAVICRSPAAEGMLAAVWGRLLVVWGRQVVVVARGMLVVVEESQVAVRGNLDR